MIIPKVALDISADIIKKAVENEIHIACAESCTGGLLAAALTNTPGSSDVFKGGVVSYTNEIKASTLGVKQDTLINFTAISEEVALEMARGVRERLLAGVEDSKAIAVSITGLAGPDGGTEEDPVGTVWFGLYVFGALQAEKLLFSGDRAAIRSQALTYALRFIRNALGD